ncbi:MAG TPA: metal-sensing transcriptional repressor [Candidatus Mediterraneibacter excrementigallinarum]|nr:metal-sensing transcriptional repressor [Candidatus Mediterraneibacter excrementigallinarum]
MPSSDHRFRLYRDLKRDCRDPCAVKQIDLIPCPLCKRNINRIFRQFLKRQDHPISFCLCPDILIQVSAVTAALNSFNKVLLAEHLHSCVVDDIKKGREDEAIDELVKVLQKLMK